MHSEAAERQLLENDLRQAIERGELCGRLPADRPRRRRGDLRLRGAGALAAPDPRRDLARQVRSAGRGSRAHRQDRRMGAAHRARGSRALARPGARRGQPVAAPVQRSRRSSTSSRKHLKETGVRADRLELEITEGVFLADGDSTDETFAKLKELGVRLALDDFGTGYSSLGYLKKAPFDKIKIDQSFVRGAASTTNRNAAIIRAIVTLAETLGMDTCAEGVETHDDLQLIRELGVSMVQGYIFGPPGRRRDSARARQQRHRRSRRLPVHPRAAPPADAPRRSPASTTRRSR